jgi:glycosyltransferase involved in cell wall biosynthesis
LPALVDQVAERGLENVRFKPYQTRESLWATLTLPDVHLISLRPALEGMVMPSKYYGVAAAGRPTIFIGDHEGEIAGLIRKADSGAVIPVGDGNTLASILVDLARDHERRRGLGVNARKDFEARFDKPVSLAIWRDLLTRLVDDCTAQRPA